MKRIIYICDKCGREIEGDPYKVAVDKLFAKPPGQEVNGIMSPHPYPEMDSLHFCKDCMGSLVDLIRHHLKADIKKNCELESTEEVATSQSVPPPSSFSAPSEKGSRRKLDTGKVRALRNAGWSVKAIAEEMQYSDRVIYQALGEMGMPAKAKNAPEPKPTEQSIDN